MTKRVSVNNGLTFCTGFLPDEDVAKYWDALVNAMDDGARESVYADLAGGGESNAEFLRRYLLVAPCDLVIG